MVSRVERYKSAFVQRGLQVPTAEKLANVAETTAIRRGRTDTVDSIFNPSQPAPPPVQTPPQPDIPLQHVEPSLPEPVLPLCAADEIFSGGSCMKKPQEEALIPEPYSPPPFIPVAPPPPPPPKPVVTLDSGEQFFSLTDFKKAEKIFSPCGSYTPYAKEQTGQMRSFCTYADFLAAGYHQSTPVPLSTRGKLCPSGLTYWGGKCLKITYADIIGTY